MSLAADTRAAVRANPFLLAALRAGVLNYAAAAAFLDLDGEDGAVATALGRYAEELPPFDRTDRDARVTMQSGVGLVDPGREVGAPDGETPLLRVGGVAVLPGTGDRTAVQATGDVGPRALAAVLRRLDAEGTDTVAAGAVAGGRSEEGVGADAGGDAGSGGCDRADGGADARVHGGNGNGDDRPGVLAVVVGRRDGARAVRTVEAALSSVPTRHNR